MIVRRWYPGVAGTVQLPVSSLGENDHHPALALCLLGNVIRNYYIFFLYLIKNIAVGGWHS